MFAEEITKPKLAVLFWCYKEVVLCRDRVASLRKQNPDTPIYILFGGEPTDAEKFEHALSPFADDFYVFDEPPPLKSEEQVAKFREGVRWKYVFGDLLFIGWFKNRGVHLKWDTVVIVQWDMLIFGKINDLFSCLQTDEALFSGLRPVAEVETKWSWTSPDHPVEREMYERFMAYVAERYDYHAEPMCFVAIVLAMSRKFLEKFATIEEPALGFLEYRLPVYADIFNIPVCKDHPFKPWWGAVEPYTVGSVLRALPFPIWEPVILLNLLKRNGARLFHPYWRLCPSGSLQWMKLLFAAFFRGLKAKIKGGPVC